MSERSVVEYTEAITRALEGADRDIEIMAVAIHAVHLTGGTLWVLGNGGSLAVAQHFAQDLVKARGIRAQCLNDPSVITAYANDDGFDYSYFNPLRVLMKPFDALLIFSVSGKSRNYIEFISSPEMPVFSVVGSDGGFLRDKSDISVHIKSEDYAVCESAFSIVADLLNYSLEEKCLKQ